MNVTLLGGLPSKPAVAVLGTWDPVLKQHEALIEELAAVAKARDLTASVIMLDPPPGVFTKGAAAWPIYDEFATRVARLLTAGIETVIHVDFSEQDLGDSADGFFAAVCGRVTLAEFWLKPNQSIGTGPKGSGLAVLAACRRRGIRLRRVGTEDGRPLSAIAREHLRAGALRKAAAIVGHPPTMRRPASGKIRVAWHAGRYEAIVADVSDGRWATRRPIEIALVPEADGMAELTWPSTTIETLAFIAGPGDDEAGAATVAS